jgi:hypothetical protein
MRLFFRNHSDCALKVDKTYFEQNRSYCATTRRCLIAFSCLSVQEEQHANAAPRLVTPHASPLTSLHSSARLHPQTADQVHLYAASAAPVNAFDLVAAGKRDEFKFRSVKYLVLFGTFDRLTDWPHGSCKANSVRRVSQGLSEICGEIAEWYAALFARLTLPSQ